MQFLLKHITRKYEVAYAKIFSLLMSVILTFLVVLLFVKLLYVIWYKSCCIVNPLCGKNRTFVQSSHLETCCGSWRHSCIR